MQGTSETQKLTGIPKSISATKMECFERILFAFTVRRGVLLEQGQILMNGTCSKLWTEMDRQFRASWQTSLSWKPRLNKWSVHTDTCLRDKSLNIPLGTLISILEKQLFGRTIWRKSRHESEFFLSNRKKMIRGKYESKREKHKNIIDTRIPEPTSPSTPGKRARGKRVIQTLGSNRTWLQFFASWSAQAKAYCYSRIGVIAIGQVPESRGERQGFRGKVPSQKVASQYSSQLISHSKSTRVLEEGREG